LTEEKSFTIICTNNSREYRTKLNAIYDDYTSKWYLYTILPTRIENMGGVIEGKDNLKIENFDYIIEFFKKNMKELQGIDWEIKVIKDEL